MIDDDKWLATAVVGMEIIEKNSRWLVYLTFKGDAKTQFLRKFVKECMTKKQAELFGRNAVKTANKDFTSFQKN